jgi:hypothetical protein
MPRRLRLQRSMQFHLPLVMVIRGFQAIMSPSAPAIGGLTDIGRGLPTGVLCGLRRDTTEGTTIPAIGAKPQDLCHNLSAVGVDRL